MIQLRWRIVPLYTLESPFVREIKRVLQWRVPFGKWRDVPEFCDPKDYAEHDAARDETSTQSTKEKQ